MRVSSDLGSRYDRRLQVEVGDVHLDTYSLFSSSDLAGASSSSCPSGVAHATGRAGSESHLLVDRPPGRVLSHSRACLVATRLA